MAVTSRPYGGALSSLLSGEINWLGSDIKAALVSGGYVPNMDLDRFFRVRPWAVTGAYVVGDVVRPLASPNGHVYRATVAGTSGSTEPVWPTAAGATVVDGGVTWAEAGRRDAPFFEAVGTGYTAGGKSLTGKTTAYDAATKTLRADAADVVWNPSTLTARFAIFYRDTGDPTTSPLLCVWDLGANQSSANGEFLLALHVNGLINLVAQQ